MKYTCPVCYYSEMTAPPEDFNICECYGTEFGFDNHYRSYAELRTEWIALGAKWFLEEPPLGWNPWKQSRTPAYACVSIKGSACRNMKLTLSGTHMQYATRGV